jgi:hypothetical protein
MRSGVERKRVEKSCLKGGCSQDWLPHKSRIAVTRGDRAFSERPIGNRPQVANLPHNKKQMDSRTKVRHITRGDY